LPKDGGLWGLLGKAHLKMSEPDYSAAEKALRRASEEQCTRPELTPLIIEVKENLGDWAGIISFLEDRSHLLQSNELVSLANARMEIGELSHSIGEWHSAEIMYKKGMIEIGNAFNQNRAAGNVEALKQLKYDIGMQYVNSTMRRISTNSEKIELWDAVVDTVEMQVFHRGRVYLAIRSLDEWWSAVEARDQRDQSSARRLRRALGRVPVLRRKLVWPEIVDELNQTVERLEQRLRGYEFLLNNRAEF
jgi:tetratricopeptide (TPR) repeat protein